MDIDPRIIEYGSKADVEREVERCLREGGKEGCVLSTPANISVNTNAENFIHMVGYAKKISYAWSIKPIFVRTVQNTKRGSGDSDMSSINCRIIQPIGLIMTLFGLLGIIPSLLLASQRRRKIGGIVSIIFGAVGVIIQVGFTIGIFSIIAGILALWRKV
jgi:hypothetical protein